MINKIKESIKNNEIISFDIFDTLLVRPYYKPEDLFFHLELLENAPDFGILRKAADDTEIKKAVIGEEISLNGIYNNLPEKYKYLKEKELNLEYQTLQANSEILEIFNYAKSLNKKVIITSDMYLPYEFVEKVLNKNGITGYHKLYLSSKENKTKRSGLLYKKIIEDLKIPANKIFHIGDNKNSDYIIPQQLGINSFLYPKIMTQFVNKNKFVLNLLKTKKISLVISVILGICAINQIKNKQDKNYFYNFGFNVAGTANYLFCDFINKEAIANKTDHIFFAARDGYTLEKSFKFFNNDIKTNYVTLNRFQKKIDKFIHNEDLNNDEQTQIILFLKQLFPNNETIKQCNIDTDNIQNFITKNYDTLKDLLSQYQKNFYSYINSKTDEKEKNIMVADSITSTFSAALLAKQILQDKNIFSISLQTRAKIVPNKIKSLYLLKLKTKYDGFENWNLMEYFFSAPTPQVLGVDFNENFIYDKENPYEKSNINAYKDISKGMIDFVKETKKIFADYELFINITDTKKWIDNFCINYTDFDYENIKNLFFSSNNDKTYSNIIRKKSLFKRKFDNTIKLTKKFIANVLS